MAAAEQQTITSIFDVLDYIEHMSKSAKEKGDMWERITAWYLRNDPQSQQVVGRVWRWSDSDNPLYDGQDTGIDIVCEDRDSKGRYWAVQCKNFDPTHKLTYEDLSTFFAKVEAKPAYCGYVVASASDALSDNLTSHALHIRQDMGITTEFLTPTEMASSNVDWSQCLTNSLSNRVTFDPRPHQMRAIRQINSSLETHDRCKAIMACGTGKTLMSLRLAEDRCPHGLVLFGAPSIALVSQAMREWTNQARESLRTLVVCSDAKASKVKADAVLDDIIDLSYPASTDPSSLVARYRQIRMDDPKSMVAIFSTYQSMQVIQDAQRTGLPAFDLAICDEAHRTTGVRTPDMTDEEVSTFQIVNDGTRIRAAKRVYMTATPRIYGDKIKQKAKETASTLCSMDDEEIYGPVAYSLPFAEAVEKQLLCDYRVVVLAVKEEDVPENIQHLISDGSELQVDDAAKIIGTYKGLANHGVAAQERLNLDEGNEADITPDFLLIDDLLDIDEPDDSLNEGVKPLHRAVGFCSRISDSKRIDTYFKQVVERYIEETGDNQGLACKLDHVDGSMDSKERASKLEWLASNDSPEECRILTNARCLAEGVDVPSLDAVIFFAPRKSEVDVVQAVGRVMRTFKNKVTGEEKKLGYIILPIVIPAGMTPEQSLNNSRTFDVVWKVLQALRSHDERMDAYVNSIPFRMTKKGSGAGANGRNTIGRPARDGDQPTQGTLDLDFGSTDLERAVYAKMVDRCGTKIYWDAWADDVAHIAEHYVAQIEDALERNANAREGFDKFLHSLRASLNPGIKPDDAVQMVANLDEPLDQNYVRAHALDDGAEHVRRIFGSKPGTYGAGLLQLIESGNWRDDHDLAAVYTAWGGYAYGRGLDGVEAADDMRTAYKRIQVAAKNVDSTEHDIADSDDYFQFHGGMVATVRALTGQDPDAFIGDSTRQETVKTRTLHEESRRVFRARVVNPRWIEAMRKHGYKGAFEMSATVDYLFGYDATTGLMDDWMYETLTDTYVGDPVNREFFEKSNPWALRDISERLMEAAERGLWEKPSDESMELLRSTYLEMEGELEDR